MTFVLVSLCDIGILLVHLREFVLLPLCDMVILLVAVCEIDISSSV